VEVHSDGSFTYDPRGRFHWLAAGESVTDSFHYTIDDGNGGSDTATVTVTVHGMNDSPLARDDHFELFAGDVLTLGGAGVLSNDGDAEGEPLTAVLASAPAGGTLTLHADGSFVYVPAADFHGIDSFTYRAHDGTAGGNLATVTLRVLASNLPPESPPEDERPAEEDQPPEDAGDGDAEPDTSTDPASPDLLPELTDRDTRRAGTPADSPGVDLMFVKEDADALATWEPDAAQQTAYESRRATLDTGFLAKRKIDGQLGDDPSAGFYSERRSGADPYAYFVQDAGLGEDLDQLSEQMRSGLDFRRILVESAAVTSAGLTVGYVVWLLRGGMLLSSFLVQMPAWRMMDPLVVLQYGKKQDAGEDAQNVESLETIIVEGGGHTVPRPGIGSES
jgi:hypothetical protein